MTRAKATATHLDAFCQRKLNEYAAMCAVEGRAVVPMSSGLKRLVHWEPPLILSRESARLTEPSSSLALASLEIERPRRYVVQLLPAGWKRVTDPRVLALRRLAGGR